MATHWIKKGVAGLLAGLLLATPAVAGEIHFNGSPLTSEEGWLYNGTSYITLRALAQRGGYALAWDGNAAHLLHEGVLLTAQPGETCVQVNGQPLEIAGSIQNVNGRVAVPLRAVEEALGGQVTWNSRLAAASLNLPGTGPGLENYTDEDLYWMARIISAESQGEPFLGQIAVGNVVLNRLRSPAFPNTVKDVIFDTENGIQFEPVENGTVFLDPTESSIQAAVLALEGTSVVGDCMYFFAPALSEGSWMVNHCTYYTTIGGHQFYLP